VEVVVSVRGGAAVFEYGVGAGGVERKERRHVVHHVVDDQPAVVAAVVLLDLCPREQVLRMEEEKNP